MPVPGGAWRGRLQLELKATFALPALDADAPTATLGLATRLSDDGAQRTDCKLQLSRNASSGATTAELVAHVDNGAAAVVPSTQARAIVR